MRRKMLSLLLALAMLLTAMSAPAALAAETADGAGSFLSWLQGEYAQPETEYYPEVRWWMNMGYHTDESLTEALDDFEKSGFSGVEFLAMGEAGNPNNAGYGWGSEEWIEDTKLLIREATERGMGFSLTSGAHWGNANLPVTWEIEPGVNWSADHPAAGQTLSQSSVDVAAGETFAGELPRTVGEVPDVTKTTLAAIVAVGYSGEGGPTELDPEDAQALTWDEADLTDTGVQIEWMAPETNDHYRLYAFWIHGSASKSEPSASTNYMINYVDPEGVQALQKYWEENILTPDMQQLIRENGRGELYMDSLELGNRGNTGLLWGFTLLDAFEERNGYRLEPYLPFLMGSFSSSSVNFTYFPNDVVTGDTGNAFIDRVRNDFYQVMTDTYTRNVLEPMTEWLHGFGMSLRAEPAYSGNAFYDLSQSAKYVDTVETESLEFATQIDSYRNFSGPARLYGKTLSSETGAIIRIAAIATSQTAYADSLERYSEIINTQLAAGIARVSLHATAVRWSDSEETAWPGYEGGSMGVMFGERWDGRHPYSEHYREWTTMIARNQKAMRQGASRSDVAILRYDNALNMTLMGSVGPNNGMLNDDTTFMYWQDLSMQEAGYNYDYFSPQLLTDENIVFEDGLIQPDGPGYKAIIVYQEELPLESAKVLLSWAQQGLPVVFVNNTVEMGSIDIVTNAVTTRTHEVAASHAFFSDESDEELAAVVAEIKALDNVRTIDVQADIVPTLQSLGVYPRAQYAEPNDTILTCMREDEENGALYLYAYNYKPGYAVTQTWDDLGEATTFTVAIEGEGKPYEIDAWTGEVEPIGTYRVEDGRTIVEITLTPAATTLIALDLGEESLHALESDAYATFDRDGGFYIQATQSGEYTTLLSNGEEITTEVQDVDDIALGPWDVTVTEWTAGEQETRTETKPGKDYTTTEYGWTTDKTPVELGTFTSEELKAWKDMGSDKSGVGTYTTTFELPEGWSDANGAILQLGCVYRGSVVAYVNGTRVPVPFESLRVDISDYLLPGQTNELTIEVGSTLGMSLGGEGRTDLDYGMVGEAKLITYTEVQIADLAA